MDEQTLLGPLTLEPLLVERIWGTDHLHAWYPQPVEGQAVGEVWLTAKENRIAGKDAELGDLAEEFPDALAGKSGGFPLLIKLLYPREKLSVQVHPNDAQAQASLGEPNGKTECWYVLSAEPGAQVALGLTEPMSSDATRSAIEDGTIEQKLRMVDVTAGDMVFVDAGTIHAIGPGMVVLETQQYSDVTYRLWDYGRPRQLHLDAGLAVVRNDTAAGLVSSKDMGDFSRLVSCPYFTVDSFKATSGKEVSLGQASGLQILISLGEGASVASDRGSFPLNPGHAVLLPDEGVAYTLSQPAGTEVIRVFDRAV